MPLIKSRPQIRVRVPNEIRPGESLPATVILDCRREVQVRSIDVTLEAIESWALSSSEGSDDRRSVLLRLGASLGGAGVLPAGRTELPLRIPLPATAPPTYPGLLGRIDYELRVDVAIPWWPDAHAAFELKVVHPVIASPSTEPGVYSSDPSGPRGREPHLELSLASMWTRVGDVVSGAFALSNVAHNAYTEVTLGLAAVEHMQDRGGKKDQRELVRYQVRIGAEEAQEGEMIPFRLRVPDDAIAGFGNETRPNGHPGLCSLVWYFQMTVGIRWGRDLVLRIPFDVLPASQQPGDAPLRLAPPTVGSDRLRAMWDAVGNEQGLTYHGHRLTGRFGETELTILREHAGRGGVHLLAEMRYPELHLDLAVEPASAVRKIVGGGVRTGNAEWDLAHFVSARDEKQAASVLAALVPSLAWTTLRRLDDRLLTITARDSGGSRTQLAQFVSGAVGLARAVEEIRRRVPPPTAMLDAVAGWHELARTLSADLETARMRIDGRLGALAAEVRVAFDAQGHPSSTWLSVRPPSPLDASHSFTWRAGAGAASDAIAAHFTGDVGDLLASLCSDASELDIDSERIALCVPSLLGVAFGAQAAERRLERMAQLTNALRGQSGPYR